MTQAWPFHCPASITGRGGDGAEDVTGWSNQSRSWITAGTTGTEASPDVTVAMRAG